MKLTHGRGYVYSIQYHVVWCVKYRRKVLTNGVEKSLIEILNKIAADNNFKILECKSDKDHIHLLIDCSPQHYIPNMMKALKGVSARLLMKEIIRAYKYRIYPNKKQKELVNKTFGCCRFVYNFCRANQKKEENMWLLVNKMTQQGYFSCNNYKSKFFNKFENYSFLKELKQHYQWLKEADKFALESSIDNLY